TFELDESRLSAARIHRSRCSREGSASHLEDATRRADLGFDDRKLTQNASESCGCPRTTGRCLSAGAGREGCHQAALASAGPPNLGSWSNQSSALSVPRPEASAKDCASSRSSRRKRPEKSALGGDEVGSCCWAPHFLLLSVAWVDDIDPRADALHGRA